jgi:hypothetical protein
VCLAVAVVCAAWWFIDRNPENRLVAVVLAVAGLAGALILHRMQVRLAADAQGLTVTGPLHSRTVAWSQIATIATPRTGLFGRRGASLEIDVRVEQPPEFRPGYDAVPGGDAADGQHPPADTELLAFGKFELGADPAAVGRALTRMRP